MMDRLRVGARRRGIHEYLDMNLNRGGSTYHEYEYENARPIMSLNSKKTQNSSVFNLNTGLFMKSPGPVSVTHHAGRRAALRCGLRGVRDRQTRAFDFDTAL